MAKYYFCNGTTASNLPCQIHVPVEKNRCHFHGDGGGPGPLQVASAVYKGAKGALDAVCYLYTLSDAAPFAIDLGKKGLDLFSALIGVALEADDLREFYLQNESEIIRRISTMNEEQLRKYVAMINHISSVIEIEDGSEKEMVMFAS